MKYVDKLTATLRVIASLGGNLPDERLTTRTGPNDAVSRGLIYCEARRLANAALAYVPDAVHGEPLPTEEEPDMEFERR